ncbi:MAG: MaoC family dehydratase [Chloroflexia bacterium]
MSVATWADVDKIQVGDTASCVMTVTAEQVDTFARLSLDDNMIHMDDAAGRAAGFPGRIAHGMLALSAISRLIGTQLPGHGSLWMSQDVQFAAPVLIGDRVEARVTVEQVSRAAQAVVLRTEAMNPDTGAVILRGTARVRVPPRKAEGA